LLINNFQYDTIEWDLCLYPEIQSTQEIKLKILLQFYSERS
jgi:hypothetical protein